MPLPNPVSAPSGHMAPIVPICSQNKTMRLRQAYRSVKKMVANLKAQNRMLQQLSEALGDTNRHYASLALGHPPSDDEAFQHYIENGGKRHFDETHPSRG